MSCVQLKKVFDFCVFKFDIHFVLNFCYLFPYESELKNQLIDFCVEEVDPWNFLTPEPRKTGCHSTVGTVSRSTVPVCPAWLGV